MVKKIPQRMCVVCKQMFNKNELTRVVKTPDGKLSVDETNKADGRGAYVCSAAECRKKCVKARQMNRAFKGDVPQSVYEKIYKEPVIGKK